MKVIALLSWYEENPAWLAECVSSASKLCDHIVAVDGAYALFPGARKKPRSDTMQGEVIARIASGTGMGLTLVTRNDPWESECAKRDYMFKAASIVADPGDWIFRIDADELLTSLPADTKNSLASTDLNVAEVTLWEREINSGAQELAGTGQDYHAPFRCLYRALPGIGVEQAHYTVTAYPDGKQVILTGDPAVHNLQPSLALPAVMLEHRNRQRNRARQAQKKKYLDDVVAYGIEKTAPF